MPLYQYKCEHCGNVFELLFHRVKFTEEGAEPGAPCPECGEFAPLVITPVAHIFKGRLASREFGGKDKLQDGGIPRHAPGG